MVNVFEHWSQIICFFPIVLIGHNKDNIRLSGKSFVINQDCHIIFVQRHFISIYSSYDRIEVSTSGEQLFQISTVNLKQNYNQTMYRGQYQ